VITNFYDDDNDNTLYIDAQVQRFPTFYKLWQM